MTDEPTVETACPVPDCGYKPPGNLSVQGQMKALEHHISLKHSITELPGVVDELKRREEQERQQPPKEEPPKEAVTVQQRPARTQSAPRSVVAPISPIDPKKDRVQERTEKWGQYLYNDFNPLLVSGAQQLAAIPDPWMDGGPANGQPLVFQTPEGKTVTFWNPPLRQQLTLSEGDCKKLAKAGANFAESPMGQALTAWLEHNAHWLAVGAAMWVAGSYGWRLMRIRSEVAQLQEVIKQQSAMQPQTAENTSEDAA